MALSGGSPRLPTQPTTCHGVVAQELALFSFPHPYNECITLMAQMFTGGDLTLRQDALQALLEHLQGGGWA